MIEKHPLIERVIVLVKQHRNPASSKSTGVLLKVMEKQILNPGNHSEAELVSELKSALASDVVWSQTVPQQHSEEELRSCFANLLAGLENE